MTTYQTKCPKCGRWAIDVRKYKDGSRLYVHEEKPGLMGATEITKSCTESKRAAELRDNASLVDSLMAEARW